MSAVAKLRDFGSAAIEEVLTPILTEYEKRQELEAERDADTARGARRKLPNEPAAMKAAQAKVAKCRAEEAAIVADLAKAKARTAEAEVEWYRISQEFDRTLRALRLRCIAPHVGRQARELLTEAVEFYRAQQPSAPAGKIAVRLTRLLNQLNAALGGDADPPADDVLEWAQQAVQAAAADFAATVQKHLETQAHSAARERAARVLG